MKTIMTLLMAIVCLTAIAQQPETIYLPELQTVIIDTSMNDVPLIGTSTGGIYLLTDQPTAQFPQSWNPDFNQGDYARNWNDIMTQRRGNPAKVIVIYMASIAFNAIGQGLDDDGNKMWGHAFNALSIGTLLASPFIIDYEQGKWYQYVLSYTFLRIAAFDPIYNGTRGLPLNYLEGNNLWDRTMSHVQPAGMMFIRGLSATVGFSIPISNLGRSCKRLSN